MHHFQSHFVLLGVAENQKVHLLLSALEAREHKCHLFRWYLKIDDSTFHKYPKAQLFAVILLLGSLFDQASQYTRIVEETQKDRRRKFVAASVDRRLSVTRMKDNVKLVGLEQMYQ